MSLYISISVCIHLPISKSMSINVYVYLCQSMSMSIYIYVYLCLCLSMSISIYVYVYLCLCISIYAMRNSFAQAGRVHEVRNPASRLLGKLVLVMLRNHPRSTRVNQDVLMTWGANMDIQFVLDR